MIGSGGLLKVAGFGLIKLSKLSQHKAKLAQSCAIFISSKSLCLTTLSVWAPFSLLFQFYEYNDLCANIQVTSRNKIYVIFFK